MSVTIRDPSPRQLIVSAVIAIVFMALAFWYLLSANGPSPGAQDAPGIAFSVAGASQCPRPATLERPRVSPRTFLRHPAVSAYRRETSCTNPALSGVGVTASDVVTVSANDLTGHCNQKAVVSVTIAPTPALIQHIKGNPAKLSFGLAIAGSGLSRPSTTFARPYFFEPPGPAAGQLGHIEAPIQIPSPNELVLHQHGWVILGTLRYWKATGAQIVTSFSAPLVRTTGFGRCAAVLPNLTGSGPATIAGIFLLPLGSSANLVTSGTSRIAGTGATPDLATAYPTPSDSFGDWSCTPTPSPPTELSGAGYQVQAPVSPSAARTCSALVTLDVDNSDTLSTLVIFAIGAMSALAIQWVMQLGWHYLRRQRTSPDQPSGPGGVTTPASTADPAQSP
ncbi:MAG: hypothetical protein ACLP4R_29980 [Solirubrobacteraceae bacterium]